MPLGWIVILGVVWLAFGLGMLLFGLFGRRSPLSAVCRRCRFDLTASGEAAVCPECGADVVAPRAVLRRPFIRRAWMIVTGTVLLLALVTAGGAAWWVQARPNLNRIKPSWMLVMEAQNAGVPEATAALTELNARQLASSLSTRTTQELLSTALARQADPNAIWLPEWGTFIESAHAAGNIDDERWADYVVRAANFSVKVRPMVRQGVKPAVIIRSGGGRASMNDGIAFLQIGRVDSANPDGRATFCTSLGGQGSSSSTSPSVFDTSEIGARNEEVRLRIGIPSVSGCDELASIVRDLTFSVPLEVVPPDTVLVRLNNDAEVAAGATEAVKPPSVQSFVQPGGRRYFTFTYDVQNPPVNLVCRMRIRWIDPDGTAKEHVLDTGFVLTAGSSGGYSWGGLEIPTLQADRVDVILEPDAERAERETNFDEILGVPIEFRDVKIPAPESPSPK